MSFVVSARKYRPHRFEDVVGQEHVSRTLKNALQNDQLAHAFLFCGPRGVGKTTCARILAKVLNCENLGADHEPCNECGSCQSFNENASFNITELDAASNNSVEHIRALIEQVRFQPQQGQYKVFIIDEVHMLSQQAFNAFLKTLEEPPSYAIFILATTEKHKIIPTILSRCQIFDFKRIQIPAMVTHLENICQQEDIQAEPDALHIIAQKADGALRDALSIFDRMMAFSGRRITYQDVITNLNVLDYDYYFKVVDALLMEDISQVMLIFDDILRKGFDPDLFINGLAEHLRNLLVCKDPATLALLEAGENLRERYSQQSALAPNTLLLTALNIANDCDVNYKMARNKRLHVEMALIKMTFIQRAVSGEIVVESKEKKTPDLSKENKMPEREGEKNLPIAKEVEVRHGEPAEAPDLNPSKNSEETEISSDLPKVEEPEPSLPQSSSPKLAATPQLKGIAALVAEVKADEQGQEMKEKDLTQEALEKYWKQYAEEECTQSAVRSVLKAAQLKAEANQILVAVGSTLAENNIRQEKGLMEFLRTQFRNPKLVLTIEKDENLAPEKPKVQKPLTPKEKYLKMREVNPKLTELQKRFDLRPDED